MRIFFSGGGTGGHLYPALAIARSAVKINSSVRPFFIGARRGIEREILPGTEFEHVLLDLHPLYRSRPWENWKTVHGFRNAFREIDRIAGGDQVAAVVGTGGYAAGAALAWGARRGVPIGIQEQNSFPGLTVRFFSKYAREVWLGFPEASGRLQLRSTGLAVDTGNPIAPPPSPRPSREAARDEWGLPHNEGAVLLVSGGSQGSRALNEAVASWIRAGVPNGVSVIWATGRAGFDSFREFESARIRVRAYLDPMASAYAAADLALTRAGAMTTAELCAWEIPMVLVPLPTAAADHQTANARALEEAGAAVLLPQSALTVESLMDTMGQLLTDPERRSALARGALARARPDAAEQIARRLLAMAGSR